MGRGDADLLTMRGTLAAILIILGLVLVPIGVVSSAARTLLTNEDAFVDTLAPLAEDPDVQGVVTAGVTGSITDAVDSLGLPSVLTDPFEPLVEEQVGEAVASDAFARAWQKSLLLSHEQLVATLSHDPSSAVTLDDAGVIELQIGPIVAEVRDRLVANGSEIAERIPDVDRGIVIYENDGLTKLEPIYNLVLIVGAWSPWVAAGLIIAGIVVAARRARATITTGIVLALIGAVLCIALAIGRGVFASAIDSAIVTPEAAGVVYDALASRILWPSIAVAAAGAVLAIAVAAVRRIRRR